MCKLEDRRIEEKESDMKQGSNSLPLCHGVRNGTVGDGTQLRYVGSPCDRLLSFPSLLPRSQVVGRVDNFC